MTSTRCRRLAAVLSSIVLGVLATAIPAGPADAAPAQSSARAPIVLFAVPGLTWADVEQMPHLRQLASRSSVGELSVKASGDVTRCAAGLTAVSAGNRTEVPTPAISPCTLDMSTWPQLKTINRHSSYGAQLGILGSALQGAGIRTVALGRAAVPMLADVHGSVDTITSSLGGALRLGGVVATVDPVLYRARGGVQLTGLGQPPALVDQRIAAVERALPPGATLIVAGISDQSGGDAQLHTIVVSGPGWSHTELRSSAAGRAPFVQLIDIAPTILTAAGVQVPSSIVGRPMQRAGDAVPPISSFVEDNRHAVLERTLGQRVFLVLGIVSIVMMVLATMPFRRGHDVARWLARMIAPAPALIFLVNGLPWWRRNQPELAYGLVLLFACLVLGGVTALVGRRSHRAGLVAMPAFAFVVLAADQLTGAHLQLSAPLGDNPLVAGRFSGMGNLDFAVMATSAVLVAGIVAGRLRPLAAAGTASAIMLAAIVVDGAPRLGNDIGGVLALVPASLVLVALVAGVRVTKLRVLGGVLVTLIVAVGVALADYSRPATDQTHVGRFVGEVLHGGAGTEVRRKMDAALASFGWTVGTFVVCFAVVLAILARRRIMAALATVPGATAAAISATILAVLGAVTNDSGIVVAAMAAIVGTSAFYGGDLGRARTTAVDEVRQTAAPPAATR
jgi:hypothetical protein